MKFNRVFGVIILFLAGGVLVAQEADRERGALLLDDFSGEESRLETSWEGFTDQVMGGVSEIFVNRVTGRDGSFLRMTGKVSTKNNGGFIQVRLKLSGWGTFDASGYRGIRLTLRGKGSGYYVFLRTAATFLPWKFYKAAIPVFEDWRVVEIPWEFFTAGDYGRLAPFDPGRLKSLALVAYGGDFSAELEVKDVSLY